MKNAQKFKEKISSGQVCFGTSVSFTDLTVIEALAGSLDFLWIDSEHNPLTLEVLQRHVLATNGSDLAPLVRVPWNEPWLIKPVLDIGAAGVIVPLVRTAEDVRQAVAACRYPPDGIRGWGPRRPTNYGRTGGSSFCQAANETVMCIVQIEHVDAVNNLDEILAVSGLDSIAVGPMDLSGSLGHMANPHHPEVVHTIEMILSRARRAGVMAGIAIGLDPDQAIQWIEKGAQWVSLGDDYTYLIDAADRITGRIRDQLCQHNST